MERPFPAYDGNEPYVFVCYAHADAETVYQELAWLRDHGINIWYDEGITPGEEFPERLGNAILGASLVLFYVSPRSVESRHCRNEVFFALDRNTPVLAIHLEKTTLPAGLALSTGTAQAILRFELSDADYTRKLLAGIQEQSGRENRIEVEPEYLASPEPRHRLRQRLRPLVWPLAIALALTLIAGGGIWLKGILEHQEQVRWAREEAMPEIRAMLENRWRDFTEPYELATEAEKFIPDDPELQAILANISVKVDIGSEPPGARVFVKNYATPDAEWTAAGLTPIEDERMPIGIFRWKFELEGYQPVVAAGSTWDISMGDDQLLRASNVFRKLDRLDELPPGMVRVQGASTPQGYIGDFFIDKHEVTNSEYQAFIDDGGYTNPDYWPQRFVDGDETLEWAEALARFTDSTGRPGPSSWIGGHYPERLGAHPVSGVSWYEAAAYARWAGKSLPTMAHWGLARGEYSPLIDFPQLGGYATFAPFSNMGGDGTVPVGSLPGVTAYGTYDQAGNVREWCSNDGSVGKIVRGGMWNDNPYNFARPNQSPPMTREPGYGFRTAIYPEDSEIPDAVFARVDLTPKTDYRNFEPVSDEIYQVLLRQFAYDRGGLDAKRLSVDESHPDWTLERHSVATPYGDERMLIHIFLPRDVAPPYQTVVYFPGSATLFQSSSENLSEYYEIPVFLSFIIRSGRAVAFPVYQGTFERRDDRYPPIHLGAPSHAYTEFAIQLVKDFRRTIDFLETRDDIDSNRLAFYGMSWGGIMSPLIGAVEDRLATIIVLSGGALDAGLPEVNPLNYAPRVNKPLLMMNGRYDTLISFEGTTLALFETAATPEENKRLRVYPTDHIPPKAEYVKEILDWLDEYFGPVQ